jgi:hypothetical protein
MESLPALAERREKKMRKKRTKKGMSNSVIAGVDLGGSDSLATILSPGGEVADRFSFPMTEEGYALFSSKVSRDARVAFEATLMAYPFSRKLSELGYTDITVAHPTELAWIVRSKKKNDRADSLKIAKLHLAGLLPESHLLGKEDQIERDLLIQRVKLGVEIGRMKSGILSYLVREGVSESLPETSDNFSVARRLAIQSLRFGDDRDVVLKTMTDRLEFMEGQCQPLEERIRRNARGQQVCEVDHVHTGRRLLPRLPVRVLHRRPAPLPHVRPRGELPRHHPCEQGQLQCEEEGEDVEGRSLDGEVGAGGDGRHGDEAQSSDQGVLRQRQEEEGAWELRPRAHDEEAREDDPSHAHHRTELEMGG